MFAFLCSNKYGTPVITYIRFDADNFINLMIEMRDSLKSELKFMVPDPNGTEHYGIQPNIKSILNVGFASAHTGSEFPEYCASKGGVLAYTKNVAMRVAEFGATCNSMDPGGVLTPINACVIEDPELWSQIMDETPVKRWATVEEIAQWAYFLTVTNTFCTGQSIVIDGGESIKHNFVWKE